MRKKWIVTGLCVLVMAAGIGCSAKEQGTQAVTVEQESVENGSGEQQEDGAPQGNEERSDGLKKESTDQQSGNAESAGRPGNGETELLDGNVRGIGDNGIVIIKTRTEETEEEGVSLAIAPAPGSETAEDYVDVNFTDDTKFELHVVKNGGANPDEDVTVKEASLSDIKGDMGVTLEGYYDGEVFIAEKVVLYEFA